MPVSWPASEHWLCEPTGWKDDSGHTDLKRSEVATQSGGLSFAYSIRMRPIWRLSAFSQVSGPRLRRWAGGGARGAVRVEQLPALAKQSFPLCMLNMYSHLTADHHLRHTARQHFGLFLKARVHGTSADGTVPGRGPEACRTQLGTQISSDAVVLAGATPHCAFIKGIRASIPRGLRAALCRASGCRWRSRCASGALSLRRACRPTSSRRSMRTTSGTTTGARARRPTTRPTHA